MDSFFKGIVEKQLLVLSAAVKSQIGDSNSEIGSNAMKQESEMARSGVPKL